MSVNLSIDQTLMKAKFHIKKDEMIEAKKLYQLVLQAFPKNLRAHQGLTALNKTRQNNDAQNPPQEAIDQLVHLYNQRQFSVVIEQAQEITNQYPETFIVWNILGTSAAQTGMLDLAINAFKNVIELNPNYAQAHNNMGLTLKEQGKLDEAIEAYKRSISLNPDYAEAFCNMGHVLQDQDNLDEAIKVYKTSITLQPDKSEA